MEGLGEGAGPEGQSASALIGQLCYSSVSQTNCNDLLQVSHVIPLSAWLRKMWLCLGLPGFGRSRLKRSLDAELEVVAARNDHTDSDIPMPASSGAGAAACQQWTSDSAALPKSESLSAPTEGPASLPPGSQAQDQRENAAAASSASACRKTPEILSRIEPCLAFKIALNLNDHRFTCKTNRARVFFKKISL